MSCRVLYTLTFASRRSALCGRLAASPHARCGASVSMPPNTVSDGVKRLRTAASRQGRGCVTRRATSCKGDCLQGRPPK